MKPLNALGILSFCSLIALLIGCDNPKRDIPKRATLNVLGPTTVEIIPSPGQYPNCLLYTVSEKGVNRQLTMTLEDESVPCEAGTPIGGVPYKVPKSEGKVRIYIIFSDRPLKGSSVAQQLNEMVNSGKPLTAMDLRAPGNATIETLEFLPQTAPGAPSAQPSQSPPP